MRKIYSNYVDTEFTTRYYKMEFQRHKESRKIKEIHSSLWRDINDQINKISLRIKNLELNLNQIACLKSLAKIKIVETYLSQQKY